MKIITILGSPKKRGNTASVLKRFEALLEPEQVERINLGDTTLRGCLGCDACQRNLDAPGCIQKDDALSILGRLVEADVIIYATPLYAWDFSAQMKALLDRQYCLVKWQTDHVEHSFFVGKRVMLLVTCGGPTEQNADLIQVIFERMMAFAGAEVLGKFVVANCAIPGQIEAQIPGVAAQMLKAIVAAAGECKIVENYSVNAQQEVIYETANI